MEETGEPGSSRPISFLGAALWTVTVACVTMLAVQMTDDARPGASEDLVNITACVVLSYSIAIFAMLRIYSPEASVRDVLGVRPASPVGSILATGAGGALFFGLSILDDAMAKRFPLSEAEKALADRLDHLTGRGERAALIVAAALVLPVFEELFYRGALFGGLRRGRPEGLAVLGSAAFFALSRLEPRVIPSALVLGLLAAWLRGRSGSLIPAVLANVAFSAVPLIPYAMGKPDFDVSAKGSLIGIVAAAVAAGLAGWIFGRDDGAERGRYLDS